MFSVKQSPSQGENSILSTRSQGQATLDNLKWVLFNDHKWIKKWDLLVLFCLIFLLFVLPYQIGVSVGFDLVTDIPWLVVNVLVNSVFFIDTFFYFFRPYREPDGTRVISLSKIRRHYLTGMFFPYLISVMPFTLIFYFYSKTRIRQYIDPDQEVNRLVSVFTLILVLRLLSFIRLIRIPKILANSQSVVDFKMKTNSQTFQLWWYFFMIIVLAHWFACFWCWTAYLGNNSLQFTGKSNWIGLLIENNSVNGTLDAGFPDPNGMSGAINRYVFGLYFAMQTITSIGYGNISPLSVAEWWVGCALQLIAGIAWAYVIGGLVGVAAGFGAKDEEFRLRADHANDLIRSFKEENEIHDADTGETIIGKDEVANSIRVFIYNQYTRSPNNSHSSTVGESYPVLDSLSPNLQKMASILLMRQKLEKIPYLSSVFLSTDEQAEVVMQSLTLEFSAGATVNIGRGLTELGRGIFIVNKGCGTTSPRAKSLLEGSMVGIESVLIEDGHPRMEGEELSFLTYAQVLFIPRNVVLDVLEKNDRAAWRGSGRWIYARTLLIKDIDCV